MIYDSYTVTSRLYPTVQIGIHVTLLLARPKRVTAKRGTGPSSTTAPTPMADIWNGDIVLPDASTVAGPFSLSPSLSLSLPASRPKLTTQQTSSSPLPSPPPAPRASPSPSPLYPPPLRSASSPPSIPPASRCASLRDRAWTSGRGRRLRRRGSRTCCLVRLLCVLVVRMGVRMGMGV